MSSFILCGSVYKIRVAERIIEEAEYLADSRLKMRARPLACKVSATCKLSKAGGNSAQLIYPHTVIIFEVQQTRDSFGKWLVKLKFHSYISLVEERNVTFEGGAVG